MQFIQPTPTAQLCQTFADIEAFKIINARRAAPHEETQPFVPTEPVTMAMLKARAIQATEESQADKSIDHTLHTCGTCGGVWRSKGYTLCAFCAGDVGTMLFLDYDQRGHLHDAAYKQKEPLPQTKEQLGHALDEFRALLRKRALWYDKTSRKMIQACHRDLCTAGGTSPKIALAIHFFKEEWKLAPEEKNTFCPE
jgi:shikimate kinase